MNIVDGILRNADRILFWVAVILLVANVVTPFTFGAYPTFAFAGYANPSTSIFLHSLTSGLSAAVWPFAAAGVIWALQNPRVGRAE